MPGISSAKAKEAPMIGKAGEHLVAAELMIRGMNVSWPSVDEGCDLVSRNGCRVQVKTGRVRHIARWCSEPVYSFHFKHFKFVALSKTTMKIAPKKKLSEQCDIVVLVGLEERRFWVVPARLLDDVHCAYMGPSNAHKFEKDLTDMQEMVKLGFSQAEIGEHYGIRQSSVGKRLQKAGTKTYDGFHNNSIRACEGKWENILDFGVPVALESQVEAPETSEIQVREE